MPKHADFRGGERSGMYSLGASNRSERDRAEDDFYATPPMATKRLLDKLKQYDISLGSVLEPAVGMGHIAKVLEDNGINVLSADIVDRGYPNTIVKDFSEVSEIEQDDIVTNPPYKYAAEFVRHSLDLIKDGRYCIMLLKIQFLEGKARADSLYKKGLNPKYVFVFPDRINCAANGNFVGNPYGLYNGPEEKSENETGGQACYCWFIWQKGFKGNTTLDWM